MELEKTLAGCDFNNMDRLEHRQRKQLAPGPWKNQLTHSVTRLAVVYFPGEVVSTHVLDLKAQPERLCVELGKGERHHDHDNARHDIDWQETH